MHILYAVKQVSVNMYRNKLLKKKQKPTVSLYRIVGMHTLHIFKYLFFHISLHFLFLRFLKPFSDEFK